MARILVAERAQLWSASTSTFHHEEAVVIPIVFDYEA